MKNINLTNWTNENVSKIMSIIAGKCDSKEETLCNFACFFKERADGDPTIKNGEDYELHLGKGSVGEVFYLASKKGDTDFNFEFDAPTFKEFGYDEQTIMRATLMLAEYLNN